MNQPTPTARPMPAAQILADAKRPLHTPAGLVGGTPVLWIGAPFTASDRGFWAKLEGHNPGGIKDRTALHMVRAARERGPLAPGAPLIESTSGTLGLGLALAGATYGHPVTVVTDPGMEPLMTGLLTAYGAEIDVVDTPHPHGGWQEARRRRVTELLALRPDAWCPDQYDNPDNIAAYAPLAHEPSPNSAGSTPWWSPSVPEDTPRASAPSCAATSPTCGSSASTRPVRPSSDSPPGPV